MTRKTPAVLAFQEWCPDITTFEASKKISAPIAMAAPVTILLSVIPDEVVDVRLLELVVNIEISDIARTTRAYWYKRLALCGQCALHRALLPF